MIERAYLTEKRKQYFEAYQEHLSIANANHGAMMAIDDILAKMDEDERKAAEPPAPEGEE